MSFLQGRLLGFNRAHFKARFWFIHQFSYLFKTLIVCPVFYTSSANSYMQYINLHELIK